MGLMDFFKKSRPNSAQLAKERLSIVIAHERAHRDDPDYLPNLKRDILEVICRYHAIDEDQIDLHVDKNGDLEVLELNIILGKEKLS